MSPLTSVVLAAVAALGLLSLGGCATNGSVSEPKREPEPMQPAATQPQQTQPAAQPAQPDTVRVGLQTTKGLIVVELDCKAAPVTTANFLDYLDSGFYDGTIFHRIVPGFVIQGGGHTPDMTEKPTNPPIRNEWRNGLKNARGTIAMAREAAPDTASSQFYINLADNSPLDLARPQTGNAGYAVFGKVVEGMDVVDAIAAVRTGTSGGHQGVPVEPIILERAYRMDE